MIEQILATCVMVMLPHVDNADTYHFYEDGGYVLSLDHPENVLEACRKDYYVEVVYQYFAENEVAETELGLPLTVQWVGDFDFDNDGVVGWSDFGVLANAWGTNNSGSDYDIGGDGVVGFAEFGAFTQRFMKCNNGKFEVPCVGCETNTHCYDAVACTADLCDAGICSNTSNCAPDEMCNLTSGICEMGDLVGAWGFEESSGPTALDSSGQGNDGTLGGGAARDASGYFGQALVTDGISGQVDLGGLDVDASELTVMAWINADDFGIEDARILSKSTGSAADEHIFMLSTIGGPHLRFRLRTDDSTSTLIGNGGTLSTGTWIHAAATYDGTTMRLYQDGVEVGSTPKSGPVAVDPDVALWVASNPGEPGQVFDGHIDEVKIFERALDAVEIQTEMTTPVPGPVQADPDPEPDGGGVDNPDA